MFEYFDKPEMTPILTGLVEASAAPLASVETAFAVDSTGFSTSVYRRWFDAKHGKEMAESTWLKAHAMVGTTTNVVTSIRVTDSSGADSPALPALVASTRQRFTLAEVSGDKAYLGHLNLRVQIGGWKPLARVLGVTHKTAANVACGPKSVGPRGAFRIAPLAAVSLDDLLAGKYPPAGVCPHCGKRTSRG